MASDTTVNHGIGGKLGKVAGRSNSGKAILHTIDPRFILGIAKVSEFGSRKYHMRNFLMAPGMCWSDVYGSLMRHLLAYWAGEELDVGPNGEFGETDDPETNMKWSGLPHIDMVAWNTMVLCTYRNYAVFHPGDDRPSILEYVGGIWRDWEAEFNEIRGLDAKSEPVQEERMRERILDQDNKGTKLGDDMTLQTATGLRPIEDDDIPMFAEEVRKAKDFTEIMTIVGLEMKRRGWDGVTFSTSDRITFSINPGDIRRHRAAMED